MVHYWSSFHQLHLNYIRFITGRAYLAIYLDSPVRILAHSTTTDWSQNHKRNMIWMAGLQIFQTMEKISKLPCLSACESPVLEFGHTISNGGCSLPNIRQSVSLSSSRHLVSHENFVKQYRPNMPI